MPCGGRPYPECAPTLHLGEQRRFWRCANQGQAAGRLVGLVLRLTEALIPIANQLSSSGQKKAATRRLRQFQSRPAALGLLRGLSSGSVGLLATGTFEGQLNGAEFTFGLHQHQRRFLRDDYRGALTRHLHGFDFSGDGRLRLSDFGGVGVDPLQS